jgi:hypothetical protein
VIGFRYIGRKNINGVQAFLLGFDHPKKNLNLELFGTCNCEGMIETINEN